MVTAELSRSLALALGYYPESVRVCSIKDFVKTNRKDAAPWCEVYRTHELMPFLGNHWTAFDYRSPDVALPLLDWLIIEHDAVIGGGTQETPYWIGGSLGDIWADTLEEAIARAVIAVKGEK